MSKTKKAKDEFNLKNKENKKLPINCENSDKKISKKVSFTKLSISSLYLMLKKLDFFEILPKNFGDEYETEDNPCLTKSQADMINKKKEMQRRAILYILQLLLICACLIHLFFFSTEILGKHMLPKLLCSFLVLYDAPFYLAVIVILFYINNFKPAKKLYQRYVIGFIERMKKPVFRNIPIFDKYSLFLSKEGDTNEILSYYYTVNTPCDT
jgi:hypothetical protein